MSWAPERVAELQEKRLRLLLRDTIAGSAYYRNLYRGLDLTRCALGDLPTTNKNVLDGEL